MIKCNNCGEEIVYIENRKDGYIACNSTPQDGYTITGRKMEVYLKHECQVGASNEIHKKQDEKGRVWVGPRINTGR